jgi:hypothetical protein
MLRLHEDPVAAALFPPPSHLSGWGCRFLILDDSIYSLTSGAPTYPIQKVSPFPTMHWPLLLPCQESRIPDMV